MKRILTLLSLALLALLPSSGAFAQTDAILSFSVLPAYPMPHDSIRVLAHCRFGYSDCSDHQTMTQDFGTSVEGAVIHCPGMAAAICYATDTFVLAPRPAGHYRFSLRLLLCSAPGANADEDSFSFSVINPAAVADLEQPRTVNAFYANGQLQVPFLPEGFGRYELKLYNALGQTVLRSTGKGPLSLKADLAAGMYVLVLSDGRQQLSGKVAAP